MRKFFKIKKEEKNNPFCIQTGSGALETMRRKYDESWSADAHLGQAGGRDTVAKNFNFSKLPVFAAIFLILLAGLVAKSAWLQIAKGDYYQQMAEGNRIRISRLEPKRGIIYDRQGRTLVMNTANFLLYFIPADLPSGETELNGLIARISGILKQPSESEIKEELGRIKKYSYESYQPLFIADNIEYEKAMGLYLESAGWPGVSITTRTRREYLYVGDYQEMENSRETKELLSLSHILGYTGKISPEELKKFGSEYLPIDYIGKMGVEYFWENELKGVSGRKQIEVDALGKEKKIINLKEAEDGRNLVLSIDLDQQLKMEEILSGFLKEHKLSRASAIVLAPDSGEVLALVSLPAYNNNQFARGISRDELAKLLEQPDKPLFNRAISGEFPSGSTIKPVVSAAALEEGVIGERTKILSAGGVRIGQWFFPDYAPGGHGAADVKRAIAESINTFFYYAGGGYENFTGLGVDRLVRYFEMFGLGAQTGIDLAGEVRGLVPTPAWKEESKGERWYIGDTYHISIGQGNLLVTPLQVSVYTAFFANYGKLYQPHLVREVLSGNDKVMKEVLPESIRQNFIGQYNIKVVREGMRQAVTAGSARSLQSLPVTSAGKTGTAQWSSKKNPHAWFTGFAPFEDPEIVVTILIEEGGEGHQAAVPVAKKYMEWYFNEYKKEK